MPVGADVGAGLEEVEEALDMGFLGSLNRHDHAAARAFAGGLFAGLEEIGCETEEVAGGIGQGVGHG